MLASALYWALILNVLRVVAVSYAAVAAQLDISVGWRGWALTLGLYAVGILLLWATDRLLIFFLLPSPETESDGGNEMSWKVPISCGMNRSPTQCLTAGE